MKKILNHLFEHKNLTQEQAKEVLVNMAKGDYNECEIAAFLSIYIMRSITVPELTGFRDALLELCIPVDLEGYNHIDLCGTGGDGKNTFNISTLASFVVAGAGEKVAKHGNYGVSSVCGSSNVLEYLGYEFTNNIPRLKTQLEKAGICFLHAPKFHPAMKNVAPVRRKLGVKTFFNMLGPMVNPSFPRHQLVGVFSLELARLYNYIYQQSDKRYVILHSLDGYDEISLTSPFKMITNKGEQLFRPKEVGFDNYEQKDLFGGDTIEEAAGIFMQVLEGKGTTAQNSVVCANAGMAINCLRPQESRADSIAAAEESLQSGNALLALQSLIAI